MRPEPDGGAAGTAGSAGSAGTAGANACPSSLAERLSVTTISTDVDIRYKRRAYDWIPSDERITLAVAPSGDLRVAWLENAGQNVRVTPLDAAGERSGPDVIVQGYDVGGLVAHGDGFMLLVRGDDPGEPLPDPSAGREIATAALLVRYEGENELFRAPLTGTASIFEETREDHRRDCAPVWLKGRLAFNGEKYGAYFEVHGCEGNWSAGLYGDKLVYADDAGAVVPGGWEWKCSINQGLRLLPEATGSFTSLCFSDGSPNQGLNWVNETDSVELAAEITEVGYSGGQFGTVVKMAANDYVVGWLSRGTAAAARADHDMAMVRIGSDGRATGPVTWLLPTPEIAEMNLHLAPYGSNLLVIWDSIDDLRCPEKTCFGSYTGTHARLMDRSGTFLTPDSTLEAPPASYDDIVVLPNGDLAWAFVPDPERNYADVLPLDSEGIPDVPPRREIAVARLRYCE
ncbi:MAG TPA: hypothetical protein VGK73_07125 [Polyangiaceae bacterium]